MTTANTQPTQKPQFNYAEMLKRSINQTVDIHIQRLKDELHHFIVEQNKKSYKAGAQANERKRGQTGQTDQPIQDNDADENMYNEGA